MSVASLSRLRFIRARTHRRTHSASLFVFNWNRWRAPSLSRVVGRSVDEACRSRQANTPPHRRRQRPLMKALEKKKKKNVNCSAWVVGKVGQAQSASIKRRGEAGVAGGHRKSRANFPSAFLHHCTVTNTLTKTRF